MAAPKKILIIENTAASGVMLSKGDVVSLSENDTQHLLAAELATANPEKIAEREKQIAAEIVAKASKPATEKAAASRATEKAGA